VPNRRVATHREPCDRDDQRVDLAERPVQLHHGGLRVLTQLDLEPRGDDEPVERHEVDHDERVVEPGAPGHVDPDGDVGHDGVDLAEDVDRVRHGGSNVHGPSQNLHARRTGGLVELDPDHDSVDQHGQTRHTADRGHDLGGDRLRRGGRRLVDRDVAPDPERAGVDALDPAVAPLLGISARELAIREGLAEVGERSGLDSGTHAGEFTLRE
jgi:hypothetical protein